MRDDKGSKSPWGQRIKWLAIVGLCLVGGGSFGVLYLLGFPLNFSVVFAGVLAFETICLLWMGMLIKDSVQSGISEARFRMERVRKKSLISAVLGLLVLVVERLFLPTGIWFHTFALLAAACLGLYALYSWIVSSLLSAEFAGKVRAGFAERWVGRLPAWLVVSFGILVIVLFDFLGGIFWWYRTYVTPEQRVAVAKRSQLLRSFRLTTIFDRREKYLGLYHKTESDWSKHYNDPNIMKWPVSRVISLAEGRVGKPAWWWRYLPDGEKLKCEPFSIEAFLRVPYYMIKQRRKVGGSTPTLQAAKNFLDFGAKRQGMGFLSTVRQKLFSEMPRSYIMCQTFSAEEMMAIYQSIVWAGMGANYGLHRLSLYFFGKDVPPKLSWNESVVAVASLPNPGRLNPWYLRSCREGKCASKRHERVYKVWLKRIRLLKSRLRSIGVNVPKELPAFRNGMGKLSAISKNWKTHDVHIRNWVRRMMPLPEKKWKGGSKVQLFYDRNLVTGLPGKPGLVQSVASTLESYREQLDDLQLTFTLIDSRSGQIAAQYGGDGHLDMALAPKPIVGSMFKVITLLVGNYWPDELPFINKGRFSKHRRRFLYHPTRRSKGHTVRNSHSMPPYVNKVDALRISANVGFVFFSLRWTWLLPPLKWMEVLRIGLEQLFLDKMKRDPKDVPSKVRALMGNPKQLRRFLIRNCGYKQYLRNLRSEAAFEAAKTSTIRALISDASVSKTSLTDLLAAKESDNLEGLPEKVKQAFQAQRQDYQKRFQDGELTLEILSWSRELRMEMGLRYLIHLAELIAGYQRKRDHLMPVLTMTLGVNNTQTHQVAALASFVASGKLRRASMIRKVAQGGVTLFEHKDKILQQPVSKEALDGVRKAMRAVLESGTAKWAGSYLKKKFGEGIFANAGAKTGTVQKTRGISCVGYLEHRAGAVTLSTPTNETLKTYRVRRSILRRKKLHKKWYEKWRARYENSVPGSRKSRRYRKKSLHHQAKLGAIEELLARAKVAGKRYHKLRKLYKKHLKAASNARKRGRKAYYRILRYRRYARYSARRARRYKRKAEFFRIRLPGLSNRQGQPFAPKTRKEKIYFRRYKYWKSRTLNSLQRKEKWLQEARKESKIRVQMKQERQQKMALYRQVLESYRDASSAFHRTHERWTLSSARACRILFRLLGHWKDWEEKVEKAPAFAAGSPSATVVLSVPPVGVTQASPQPTGNPPTVPGEKAIPGLRNQPLKLAPNSKSNPSLQLAPGLRLKSGLLQGSAKKPASPKPPPGRKTILKLPSATPLKILQAPPKIMGETPDSGEKR